MPGSGRLAFFIVSRFSTRSDLNAEVSIRSRRGLYELGFPVDLLIRDEFWRGVEWCARLKVAMKLPNRLDAGSGKEGLHRGRFGSLLRPIIHDDNSRLDDPNQ